MRVLLVHPPFVSPWSPYLSLAALAAYLRAHGVNDVNAWDLNLEFFEDLTEPRGTVMEGNDRVDWEAVRQAKTDLRTRSYTSDDERELTRSLQQLDAGISASSRRYGATRLGFFGGRKPPRHPQALLFPFGPTAVSCETPYSYTSSVAIRAAVEDREQNPFLDFYQRTVVDALAAMRPGFVGITIAFPAQLIPAFSLAQVIKDVLPGCHVALGGAEISKLRVNLKRSAAFHALLLPMVDSVVIGEGENALLQLIQALARREELGATPNLLFRKGRRVSTTAPAPAVNVATLPTPEFEQLDLDRYLCNGSGLSVPLQCTRGCYWGQCTFCDSSTLLGAYRARPARLLLADVETLFQRHDIRGLQFADEALPPAAMRALSSHISQRQLPIQWSSYARFERIMTAEFCQQLAAGGCRVLFLGLESASARVNELMHKGVDDARAAEVLRNLHDAGIDAHIFSIIGFPGEEIDDAQRTRDFLMEHRDLYVSYSLVPFLLERDSAIGREPGRFGVTPIEIDENQDLVTYDAYVSEHGLSMDEAIELYDRFNEELASAGAYNPIFV